MRRGATLAELVVTMALLTIVLALIARASLGYQRLHLDLKAREVRTRAAEQAMEILAVELEPLSPEGGDLAAGQATDSAVEFNAVLAAAIACDIRGATVRLPSPSPNTGTTFAEYVSTPSAGDQLFAFDGMSEPEHWSSRTIVHVRQGGAACAWADVRDGFTLTLDSALTAERLAPVRITRRTRYSLYRGGDQQWYLGMRDWNASSERFNGIQPVSGPYRAYSGSAALTGLRFTYVGAGGRALDIPVENTGMIRRVDVTLRGATANDSAQRLIAFHHAR